MVSSETVMRQIVPIKTLTITHGTSRKMGHVYKCDPSAVMSFGTAS